jgi:hypothetical protein
MSEEIQWCPRPRWEKGVPWCTEEGCPEYDGKRCKMMGFRPCAICEPAVAQLVEQVEGATARAANAEGALAKIASGMAWPLNDDLPVRMLDAVKLATADAMRWEKRALEAEGLLRDREQDLKFEQDRAEAFEKACEEIATALGWPILPHPEDVSKLVEAVQKVVALAEQAEELAEGKRDCDVCVWDGLDCNDKQPEGCTRWLCVPPGMVPKSELDAAEARAKRFEQDCGEFRRRAESFAVERPWTGYLLMHIPEDGPEPAGVVVDFETSDGPSDLWLPLVDVPEGSRERGSKCRIEWSQERWTQVELEEARKKGERLAKLLLGDEPPEGGDPCEVCDVAKCETTCDARRNWNTRMGEAVKTAMRGDE